MLWSVVAERSSALDSSSGVVRMWVRIPAWPVAALVSLSKTLNHNCFVLRMGRKAVGPVCCVMHVKEPRTLNVKENGLAPVFLEWQQNALKLFAPWNKFSLDRWRVINALLLLIIINLWHKSGTPTQVSDKCIYLNLTLTGLTVLLYHVTWGKLLHSNLSQY